MKSFDFADIEKVNRIELKPGEIVVFKTDWPLTPEDVAGFREHFAGTPLAGRTLFLSGEWKIATITAEEEE